MILSFPMMRKRRTNEERRELALPFTLVSSTNELSLHFNVTVCFPILVQSAICTNG